MVSITCYGGVRQIGGNQVLVEDGDCRVFLDFGTPYAQWNKFYEEYMKPRAGFGLLDLLELDLLPPLKGFYRSDLYHPLVADRFSGLHEVSLDAVLLSHAHMDHSGYISFLMPDIPVFTSPLTAFVAKAIQDTSRDNFEAEVAYAIPRAMKEQGVLGVLGYREKGGEAQQRPFCFPPGPALSGAAGEFWRATPWSRQLKATPWQTADNIKGRKLLLFPVDHSIPGACGFALETGAGWVAYTGDLRFHGAQGKDTDAFIQGLEKLRPHVLVCEGTRAEEQERPQVTEEQVFQRALTEVQMAQGHLVIADFGPRNLERLRAFQRIAQETGRRLAIVPRDVYLLQAVGLLEAGAPQAGSLDGISIYVESKASAPDRWEREVRRQHQSRLMTAETLHREQDSVLLCFSFLDLNDLPTIRPRPGSLYLYSSHEAYDEEQGLDFRRLHRWLDHFQFRRVGLPVEVEPGRWEIPPDEQGLHASGHAPGGELLELVRRVCPKMLIPVHAAEGAYDFYREGLRGTGIRVEAPERGVPIAMR